MCSSDLIKKSSLLFQEKGRFSSCYHLSSQTAHTGCLIKYGFSGGCSPHGLAILLHNNGCLRCSLLPCGLGAELRDVFRSAFPAPLISRLLSVGLCLHLLLPITVFEISKTIVTVTHPHALVKPQFPDYNKRAFGSGRSIARQRMRPYRRCPVSHLIIPRTRGGRRHKKAFYM